MTSAEHLQLRQAAAKQLEQFIRDRRDIFNLTKLSVRCELPENALRKHFCGSQELNSWDWGHVHHALHQLFPGIKICEWPKSLY